MDLKQYYSIRKGSNPCADGFGIEDLRDLFLRLYKQLEAEGYFTEAFGFYCVDSDYVPGTVIDPEYEVHIKLRKRNVWPVEKYCDHYTEDDLFDITEFLYEHVSKPTDGIYHDWNQCGMHWEKFNREEGQAYFQVKINELFRLYNKPFCLTKGGEVLEKPEKGFEKIFEANIPLNDDIVRERLDMAIVKFRRHGVSIDDRRQAVRDLADVLEYLRPQVKSLLSSKDESDLFNIANNFGIRHHNEKQKTNYDAALWLSWMFYYYLSTIHLILRKIDK